MAVESAAVLDLSFRAGVDLSSSQFCYVALSTATANDVLLCTGSSVGAGGPIGVLQNDPSSYQAATVRCFGVSKAYASAAIAIGDPVTSTTAGTAMKAVSTGANITGWAISATTAAGQYVSVLLTGRAALMGSTA